MISPGPGARSAKVSSTETDKQIIAKLSEVVKG